jgi:hypothetical protein
MSNLRMPLLSVASHGTASAMAAPKDIHDKPTVDSEFHCRLGSRTGIHFISLRLIVSR